MGRVRWVCFSLMQLRVYWELAMCDLFLFGYHIFGYRDFPYKDRRVLRLSFLYGGGVIPVLVIPCLYIEMTPRTHGSETMANRHFCCFHT